MYKKPAIHLTSVELPLTQLDKFAKYALGIYFKKLKIGTWYTSLWENNITKISIHYS